MDIKKLQALVVDALEDVKAQDIKLYDTTHLTSLFDRIAIASGTSNRQTKALAASVRDKVKENGGHITSMEGEDTGEWVLVDLGDMIVHIMQPAIRAYYRLEEIWGEKEVKFGAAKRISKRTASEPESEEAKPKKAGRHLASSKATTEIEVEPKTPRKRATRATTTVDEEVTPKKRATRSTTKAEDGAAPKPRTRKPASDKAGEKAAAKPARAPKVPEGKKVKVAATKASTAPRKAPAKRPAKA